MTLLVGGLRSAQAGVDNAGRNSMEEWAIALVGEKIASAQLLYGDEVTGAIVPESDDDFQEQLAQAALGGREANLRLADVSCPPSPARMSGDQSPGVAACGEQNRTIGQVPGVGGSPPTVPSAPLRAGPGGGGAGRPGRVLPGGVVLRGKRQPQ